MYFLPHWKREGLYHLIFLKNSIRSYHVHLHTKAYHDYVTERLRLVAGDKAGVEEAKCPSFRGEYE